MKKKNNEVGREVALQISKYSNIQSQELKYRILGRKQTQRKARPKKKAHLYLLLGGR